MYYLKEKEKLNIISLYEKNSINKIANIYKVDRSVIKRILKEENIKINNKGFNFSKKQINLMKKLYVNNYNLYEICDYFKLPSYRRRNIKKILNNNNVQLRKRTNTCEIDENYFKIINTEVKAYILGYLLADGCIYNNKKNNSYSTSLYVAIKDEFIINLILKETKSSYKKSYIKSANKNWQEKVGVNITNTNFTKNIINTGITENKTFTAEIPYQILNDKINLRHFIRGYIDGDGCISRTHSKYSYPNLSIRCTENMSIQLKEIFINIFNIKSCYIKDKSSIGSLNVSKRACMKILHWLYNDSIYFLKRKKSRYNFFVKYYEENKNYIIRTKKWNHSFLRK